MPYEQLMQLYRGRQRQQLNPGLRRKQHLLLKRLRKATKAEPLMEKPEVAKAEVFPRRPDVIIPSQMVGSMVGVYNGKTFSHVEIKPEMIGHYLALTNGGFHPQPHKYFPVISVIYAGRARDVSSYSPATQVIMLQEGKASRMYTGKRH
uniref:40S ribosomal protein S15 n=1 Tax=Callithrix jacchus TaxID=9483 RepID=A0A8I3WAQ2_CALJA|nr:40S ribosomal protein S15-like isoform X1 [Callithrix jacchus]